MSRKNAGSWRQNLDRELRYAVNNVNRKITRLEKSGFDGELLPDRQSVPKLREQIETYNDYRRVMKNLKSFTEKGSEKVISDPRGGKQTKWEVEKRKRDAAAYNRRVGKRREEIQAAEAKIAGLGLGYSRKEMTPHDKAKLNDIKVDFNKLTKKERAALDARIDSWLNPARRHEREQRMIDNYVKGLKSMGYLNVDPSLEDAVRELSFDEFLDMVKNDEVASFEFLYGRDEIMLKITSLKAAISNIRKKE